MNRRTTLILAVSLWAGRFRFCSYLPGRLGTDVGPAGVRHTYRRRLRGRHGRVVP